MDDKLLDTASLELTNYSVKLPKKILSQQIRQSCYKTLGLGFWYTNAHLNQGMRDVTLYLKLYWYPKFHIIFFSIKKMLATYWLVGSNKKCPNFTT